jgi:hypothetical protein
MTKNELRGEYFDWIRQLVLGEKYSGGLYYGKLLRRLNDTEFVWSIDTDGNRAADGIGLRYRFGHEDPAIASYLDDRPCSVLEALAGLALRCEEQIMEDDRFGDRTGQWFWGMIFNLGLRPMDDANFDETYTDAVVSRFLNREHGPNGEGGLFTVENPRRDLREVDIWYQMCWYLCQILE